MRYVVKFIKRVMGDNGRQADLCQRQLEIDADSQPAALERAKRQFCAAERVRDWKTRADRIELRLNIFLGDDEILSRISLPKVTR
jgi:hypothetical protein